MSGSITLQTYTQMISTPQATLLPICRRPCHYSTRNELWGSTTKLRMRPDVISRYYKENRINPNPSKMPFTSAQNRQTSSWTSNGKTLKHTDKPTYLDRSFTYRFHCNKTRQKFATKNNILKKLASSRWGAGSCVLKITWLKLNSNLPANYKMHEADLAWKTIWSNQFFKP